MAARKLSQTQILQTLGIPTTKQEINAISGNGRLQQFINQKAAAANLPEPFDPSTASAIIQDLLPIAGLASVTAAPAEAGSGAAADAGAATSGAATGATGGYLSSALNNLSTLAKAGGIAALLVDPTFLWRAVKIVGGLALAYLGVKVLATVGAKNL